MWKNHKITKFNARERNCWCTIIMSYINITSVRINKYFSLFKFKFKFKFKIKKNKIT